MIVEATRGRKAMADYGGDKRTLEQLRARFREGLLNEVLTIASKVINPERMSQSEQKMIEIARKTSGS